MKTELLKDSRFSSSTCITLFGLMHNDFAYGDKGMFVESRLRLEKRKPRLGKAKKEVELIGGELIFSPRGNNYIDVHFFIPL